MPTRKPLNLLQKATVFILFGLSLFSSVFSYAEVVPLGASPINPNGVGRQTKGWHDVYLTHRRICKACRIIDLGNERLELVNQKGVRGEYLSTEILGVDYHPWQRWFTWHVLRNVNPIAGNTLMPKAYNQQTKDAIDGTQGN